MTRLAHLLLVHRQVRSPSLVELGRFNSAVSVQLEQDGVQVWAFFWPERHETNDPARRAVAALVGPHVRFTGPVLLTIPLEEEDVIIKGQVPMTPARLAKFYRERSEDPEESPHHRRQWAQLAQEWEDRLGEGKDPLADQLPLFDVE